MGWRSWCAGWRSSWARRLGIEQCRHLAGPLRYEVFREIDSLQLHAPFDQRQKDLADQRSSSHAIGRGEERLATRFRQSLIVLVGVAVGVVAVLMTLAIQTIWQLRRNAVLYFMSLAESGAADGFVPAIVRAALVAAAFTGGLALAASTLVAWKPAAASSGIPGVIAFLNGCDLRDALGGHVFVAKTLGTVLAVGSGLAVGPEGPMVHIGAIVGMLAVRRCVRPALRFLGPRARRLEDELSQQPLRYHVQAAAMGAGAGIAAAFHAPFAGTLFVVEEAASYFSKRLFLQTFIACACAVLTAWFLENLLGMSPETFYSRTPHCASRVVWSWLLLAQVVLVGVLCSFLAIVFNKAVVWLSIGCTVQAGRLGRGRRLFCRRFAAVAAVSALCGAFAVCLPAALPCRDASMQNAFAGTGGCIVAEWLDQFMAGSRSVPSELAEARLGIRPEGPQTSAFVPSPGLFGAQYDPHRCPFACASEIRCRLPDELAAYIRNRSDLQSDHYCCGFSNLTALRRGFFFDFRRPVAPLHMNPEQWTRGACSARRFDADNKVWIERYSPAASLLLTAPSSVVRNLLVRGAPEVLPGTDLALFLVGYLVLVVLCASAWVPGGLLVPMMIIGSAAGRLCGLTWYWALHEESAHYRPQIPWIPELDPLVALLRPELMFKAHPGLPPEPGVLAMAGCAAFLSGSGHLMLFVLVLLVEITLEPTLVPIIIVAVLAARCTTSLMGSEGLYHILINVQSLPFLREHGHWRQGHHVVADVLEEDERRARFVLGALGEEHEVRLGPFSSDASSMNSEFRDTATLVMVRRRATRAQVRAALERCLPGDARPMVHGFPVVEDEGQLCGLATRKALETLLGHGGAPGRGSGSGFGSMGAPLAASVAASLEASPSAIAGVERVMDSAPFVVQASTPVLHAHMLFSRCGLRHVVVVDSGHRPIGVLTRKSLMPWRTPWVDLSMLHHDTYLETRTAHSPRQSPGRTPPCTPPGTPSWQPLGRAASATAVLPAAAASMPPLPAGGSSPRLSRLTAAAGAVIGR